MRWRGGRRSSNIVDVRGRSGFRRGGGGLRLGGRRAGGLGVFGVLVVLGIGLLLGIDPGSLLNEIAGGGPAVQQGPAPGPGREDEIRQFVSVVLADTEDTWPALLQRAGAEYREPDLVLFTGAVGSACGFADSAVGPFYCPGDQRIYLDTRFFDELAGRFGAPGDFAQAYVIAHEVGHHVQGLLGILDRVREAQRGLPAAEANALQVRVELQADCFAGLWAHHADRARGILEAGDVAEALGAASAIGDDTLQRRSQGTVVPDSFTHGTSAQRARWFTRGFESGTLQACDSFAAETL